MNNGEWISVKDSKPPYGVSVVLYTANTELLRWQLGRWETGHGYIDSMYRGIHNVTHWQPLPDPPMTSTRRCDERSKSIP